MRVSVLLKQDGLGLTELLVALVLSMLLMLVLMQQMLLMMRESAYVHEKLDEAVELQWVLDWMRTRVHHAGFTPCHRLDRLKAVDTRDVVESLRPIEVVEGETPRLSIRKMNEEALGLVDVRGPNTLFVADGFLKSDRPVLIADCMHAEVHVLRDIKKSATGYVVHLKKPLVFDYPGPVYVGEFISESFFYRKQRLFYQQHRVDAVTSWMRDVAFYLELEGHYPRVVMKFISRYGVAHVFHARLRMP
jgi:hypothetical protein